MFQGATEARTIDGGMDDHVWLLRFRLGKEELQARFPLQLLEDPGTESQLLEILRAAKVVPYPPKRR